MLLLATGLLEQPVSGFVEINSRELADEVLECCDKICREFDIGLFG